MTEKTSNSQKPINRREMLKKGALAAGGAVTAAAFLDGKWLKPIVKTGILPVHAQASVCAEYTFVPSFTWNFDGEVFGLGVTVLPTGCPDGPITYEIMAIHNIIINPVVGTIGSGTVSGGEATFTGEYTFVDPHLDSTVTIKWTYDGCEYTQTYGTDIIDWPEEEE